MLLRFETGLSSEIAKLSPPPADFMSSSSAGQGLPAAMSRRLERNSTPRPWPWTRLGQPQVPGRPQREATPLPRLEIEAALIDASPFRHPLFELLLSVGSQALKNAEDFPRAWARFSATRRTRPEDAQRFPGRGASARADREPGLPPQPGGGDKSSVKHIFSVPDRWREVRSDELHLEALRRGDRPKTARSRTRPGPCQARSPRLPGPSSRRRFGLIKRIKRVVGSAT